MILETGTRAEVPLPEFSQSAVLTGSRSEIGFRRFGVLQRDLAFDFSTPDRAALATALLIECTVDPDGALPNGFFEQLSVGKRIECLLFLATGSSTADLSFPFKCSECGEELELELSVGELSDLQRAADAADVVAVEIGGQRIKLRKSSARDQAAWAGEIYVADDALTASMIARLALEPFDADRLAHSDLEAIDTAMDEADPLVNFSCGVDCPQCGTTNLREVDLFETALSMLEGQQNQTVVMVHRLASRYHWSEQEIFAVPERRRRQYLQLIEGKK